MRAAHPGHPSLVPAVLSSRQFCIKRPLEEPRQHRDQPHFPRSGEEIIVLACRPHDPSQRLGLSLDHLHSLHLQRPQKPLPCQVQCLRSVKPFIPCIKRISIHFLFLLFLFFFKSQGLGIQVLIQHLNSPQPNIPFSFKQGVVIQSLCQNQKCSSHFSKRERERKTKTSKRERERGPFLCIKKRN